MNFISIMTNLFLICSFVYAEDNYRRLVNFEWDVIPNAISYEIHITPFSSVEKTENQKSYSFETKTASWNGRLPPGNFHLKIRSKDRRGVPGEWSNKQDFSVSLEPVHPLFPLPNAQIKNNNSDFHTMNFRWKPAPLAVQYSFTLTSKDGQIIAEELTKENNITLKIPIAKQYQWKIFAISNKEVKSDTTEFFPFEVWGDKLTKPSITKPENDFVRQLAWSRPNNAETFDYSLLKLNRQTKKWEKIQLVENSSAQELSFPSEWPGGEYQLQVRAKAPLRLSSDVVIEIFRVYDGDRSPASELTHTIRQSIDRVNGWYGIASYLITQVNYKTDSSEYRSTKFDAIGGTGRLGLGLTRKNSPWGVLSIIDLSGFTTDAGTATHASLEINSVYKKYLSDTSELRLQAGIYYKELPMFIPNPINLSLSNYPNIKYIGPHLALEYWLSITAKIGFQLHSHLYQSMITVSTVNGKDIEPSTTYQLGLLGSYRMSNQFTGLLGYSYRMDESRFASSTGSSSNSIQLSGHYLNLYAEYSF